VESSREIVAHALERARAAGAYQAEAAWSAGEAFETRVCGREIDFVKQSREQGLSVRVFCGGRGGLSSATARTSDLSRDVVPGPRAVRAERPPVRPGGADRGGPRGRDGRTRGRPAHR